MWEMEKLGEAVREETIKSNVKLEGVNCTIHAKPKPKPNFGMGRLYCTKKRLDNYRKMKKNRKLIFQLLFIKYELLNIKFFKCFLLRGQSANEGGPSTNTVPLVFLHMVII